MRDNASQRILSPRKVTVGADESLENTYGRTLIDGAQCYVTEAEATYRFLKNSVLHADGTFVVAPVDEIGRWVREGGTMGFALLDNGEPAPGEACVSYIGKYADQQLVQFATQKDGAVLYTGAVPRMALVYGLVALGAAEAEHRTLSFRHGDRAVGASAIDAAGYGAVSGIVTLRPGHALRLAVTHVSLCVGKGLLRIVLA